MPKTDIDCLQKLPSTSALKGQFAFIDDEVLLENIAITMQYIMFLLTLENSHSLPGSIGFTILKDIIIHTGSIVESMLWYGLSNGVEKGKYTLKEVGITEEKYKDFKLIHILSDDEVIGSVHKTVKLKEPKQAMLNELIKAVVHIKLVDESLSLKLHEIKKDRNKQHLGSLSTVDSGYTLAKVNDMFATVRDLKEKIITVLA